MPRPLAPLLLIAALSAAGGLAHAQPSPQALDLERQGNAAMEDRRYADALTLYRQAHEKSGDPLLLFNIARALQRMGDNAGALAEFEHFKREAPASLQQRAKVDQVIAEISARLAAVTFRSNAPKARLTVRGKPLGEVPSGPVRLDPGEALIEATADGFAPLRTTVQLNAGEATTVDLKLTARERPTRLRVTSPAEGATVEVDGQPQGVAPIDVPVTPGEHRVVVRGDGSSDASATLTVQAGETRLVDLAPSARKGLLSRWWFWTGVGVLVVGGVALGVALTTERDPGRGSIGTGRVTGPLLRF